MPEHIPLWRRYLHRAQHATDSRWFTYLAVIVLVTAGVALLWWGAAAGAVLFGAS